MRVSDDQLKQLESQGFTLVPGFLDDETLKAAQAALWQVYPHPTDYFANPAKYPKYEASQFAGMSYFPCPDWALNGLPVYPDLIDAAERFLGTTDLEIYKIELWAKYSGAINYDQAHHRDYGNHTLAVPAMDGRHRQMTTFILLSDVTLEDGPTKIVPLDQTRNLPLVPDRLAMGDYFDREVSIIGKAGSLMIYRTDVLHRGSNITGQGRSRFAMLVDFQKRGWAWQGRMSWPDRALKPEMNAALSQMTPRQRDLFNWPPVGSEYWTEQTLRDVAARYPNMDMAPYRQNR
jgi:ectoine hydroxylase-related dioxygenase (phytanoyl-CoA dioxygenase family)